jgi:flagellar basal-body rod modification protein FlgD
MISAMGNNNAGILNRAAAASNSTGSSSQTQQTTAKAEDSLGQDAFLTLLVAELEHQDPLNPMDNNQFISQLATFHSLEKLTSIDDILKKAFPKDTTS